MKKALLFLMLAMSAITLETGCSSSSDEDLQVKSLPVFPGTPNTFMSPQALTFGSRRRFYVDTLIPIGTNDTLRIWKLSGTGKWVAASPTNGLYRTDINFSDIAGAPNMSDYYLVSNPAGYITGITGPMVTSALGYSPLQTETDPVFSSSASAGITGTAITNWNAAYGWGNHAGLYPLLSGTYSNPTWIGSLASSKVTWAGATSQYIRGDGSLATFPSIPSAQVNSDWNSSAGVSQILNKPALATVATSGSFADLSGTSNVVLTGGSYSNPSWITAIALSKVTFSGSSGPYVAGNGALTTFPTIPTNTNQLTNGSGFITASDVNSSLINSALGYTPYNGATNPSGFISSETDPQFDTKFAAKSTSGLAEGTNLYFTNTRARSAISLTTTGVGAATYNASTGVLNIPTPSSVTGLPSQTGNSGKILSTDGTNASWIAKQNYTSYEAIVNQTGTSNPVAARYDANFSGVTFTWARTSAGVYTLTASSATFTSGKTVCIVSEPVSGLNRITYTVTSSTVITFNTQALGILSLVINLIATDAIFNNTLVEVRVYP